MSRLCAERMLSSDIICSTAFLAHTNDRHSIMSGHSLWFHQVHSVVMSWHLHLVGLVLMTGLHGLNSPTQNAASIMSPSPANLLLRLGKLLLDSLVHGSRGVGGKVLCALSACVSNGDVGRYPTSRPDLLICSLLETLSVPWPEAG